MPVPLKTPAGNAFAVSSVALMAAIEKEWQAQGKKINPASMPFTQLAMTAIDIAGKERGKIVDQLTAYVESELLCHRAAEPPELAERQQRVWQPVLDWCAKRFKAKLNVGSGVMPIEQAPEAVKALRDNVEAYDNFYLVGLQQAASVSGSLVLALGLVEGHLSAMQVFNAAELDACFQIEKWGEDAEAATARNQIRRDLEICEMWFELLKK